MDPASSLSQRHQHDARKRRLMQASSPSSANPSYHLSLVREHKSLPVDGEMAPLPAGACTRVVDAAGRIKLGRGFTLSGILGWEPGDLSVQADGRWLILTPQAHDAPAVPRKRFSSLARFTRDGAGTERLCLAPAHKGRLLSGEDRSILIIPLPASSTLLLADPLVCLIGAPPSVLAATAVDLPD